MYEKKKSELTSALNMHTYMCVCVYNIIFCR